MSGMFFSFNDVTAVQNVAAVSVGSVATLLVPSSAQRKALRFQNNGVFSVYIGGAGVTSANGLELLPGTVWSEDDGAAAAWYGVCIATCVVNIQELV